MLISSAKYFHILVPKSVSFHRYQQPKQRSSLSASSASVYPRSCVASGSGLQNATVETPLNVTLQSMDFWGNKLTSGGTNYTFTSVPHMASWAFYDNMDGTATLSHTPEISGDYSIDILQGGGRIANSPFTGLSVAPGKGHDDGLIRFFNFVASFETSGSRC
jgi:hypothetical protein